MQSLVYPFLHGFLGQWHPCQFSVEGVQYDCAEQYMMHQKAILFGDLEMAERILQNDKPFEQKLMGQRVQGFQHLKWEENKIQIVTTGNRSKFSQNAGLRKKLLATGEAILAEGNPNDIIWGTGLSEDDPDIHYPDRWRGQNLLGVALMKVRAELAP